MGDCVGVPYRHIRHQGAVLSALGRVALAAVTQRSDGQSEHQGPPPDTVVHAVVPPRDDAPLMTSSDGQVAAISVA